LLEKIGDAAALEHDAAAGDLGWVSSEDWGDADSVQQSVNVFGGKTGFAETAKSSAQIAPLDRTGGTGVLIQLKGETATFAMVGFSKVNEFEVEAEGASELVGGGQVEGVNACESLLKVVDGSGLICGSGLWGFGLATGDGDAAKSFDGFVEGLAGLLAQYFAE
jgi:hypothetical protein